MGASQLPPPPPPPLPLLRLVRPRLQRPPQLRRLPRLPPVRLWRLLHPLLPLRPGPWQPRPPGTQPTQACSWWGQQRRGPAAPRPVPVQAPPVSATAGRVCQSTACCSLLAAQAAQDVQHSASGHARQLVRPTLDLSFEKSPMAGCSGGRAAVHAAQLDWYSHRVGSQGWSTLQMKMRGVGWAYPARRQGGGDGGGGGRGAPAPCPTAPMDCWNAGLADALPGAVVGLEAGAPPCKPMSPPGGVRSVPHLAHEPPIAQQVGRGAQRRHAAFNKSRLLSRTPGIGALAEQRSRGRNVSCYRGGRSIHAESISPPARQGVPERTPLHVALLSDMASVRGSQLARLPCTWCHPGTRRLPLSVCRARGVPSVTVS